MGKRRLRRLRTHSRNFRQQVTLVPIACFFTLVVTGMAIKRRLIPLTQAPLYVVSEGGRAWGARFGAPSGGARTHLAEFQKGFPDEPCCAAFLSSRRWPDGFVCPACGKRRAVALKSRPRLLECLDCGRQTSLTAGTAMHRSKLPLTTWFWAAHVMSTHSNGMSARQFEDHSASPTRRPGCWRTSFGARWSIPTAIFSKASSRWTRRTSFRAGDAFFEPSAAGKILVVGAVEVINRSAGRPKPRRKDAKYLDTRSGRLRLSAIADNSAKSIETFVRANVKPGVTLITDGHPSYPGLSGDYRHDPRVVGTWRPASSCPGATAPSRC